MPCDTSHDLNTQSKFTDVLDELSSAIYTHLDVDFIVIGGDLNTDLGRHRSMHVEPLKEFCSRHSLAFCIEQSVSSVKFTYYNDFNAAQSTVDHFIVSENLVPLIVDYSTNVDGDNLSDHVPLSLKLNTSFHYSNEPRVQLACKISWRRATDHNIVSYKERLRVKLNSIVLPRKVLLCPDLDCSSHSTEIDTYYGRLIDAMKSAASECIPRQRKKALAGWSEVVTPYRNKSIFWNKVWVENGMPEVGLIRDIRQSSKKDYKHAAKWVIRNQDNITADRMATKLHSDMNREFWDEVKRVRGNAKDCAGVIDDAVGEDAICDVFASKYEELYSSVSFNADDMVELRRDVDIDIRSKCCEELCYSNHAVTVQDIKEALGKLKLSKSDADPDLSSDHFKRACPELYVHLSFLLTSMLRHTTAPSHVLCSIIRPIPKNRKKSLSVSSNYRSVAISSVLLKVLDHVILKKHASVLSTSDLQFGFKSSLSTTQCTYVLNEVVDYYTRSNSSVFVCLLDASRAFDRVHYIKLFNLLRSRDLCPLLIKLMLNMYSSQSLAVKWQNKVSSSFRCSNGIKQGAVLSPVLFCVYMDSLLIRLKESRLGCYVGNVFVGAVSYADDITLIAPTLKSAQSLLDICEQFASEFHVLFNSTKSNVIVLNNPFRKNYDLHNLVLNNAAIPYTDRALHLGSFIGKDANKFNIKKAMQDLNARVNMLVCNYSFSYFDTLCFLFKSYCTSYYGSPLWKLDVNSLEDFCICWRKAVRKLLGLNSRTRSKFLPHVLNVIEVRSELISRFSSFYLKLIKSENSLVSTCCSLMNETPSTSIVASNLQSLSQYVNKNISEINSHDFKTLRNLIVDTWLSEIDHSTFVYSKLLIELLQMKSHSSPFMSFHEILIMLNFICLMPD
jgi:hypothetical protein